MSSTLTVTNLTATNLTDGGGTTSTFASINEGHAKAWVNFTGTGTVAIDDSTNMSSVTDNSTGRYNPNFATSFATANYCVTHGCQFVNFNGYFHSYHTKSASTVEFLFINTNAAYEDSADVSATYNGDLA